MAAHVALAVSKPRAAAVARQWRPLPEQQPCAAPLCHLHARRQWAWEWEWGGWQPLPSPCCQWPVLLLAAVTLPSFPRPLPLAPAGAAQQPAGQCAREQQLRRQCGAQPQ